VKISVALCTWNGERHLEGQLRSILSQERLPDELVLRDDGSSDRTLEVAHDVLGGAPFRVDIHRNEATLGSTANFESALIACTGDILLPCDQDDLWHPDKIRRCVDALADTNADAVFHDARLVDGEGLPLGPFWSYIGLDAASIRRFTDSPNQLDCLLRRPFATGCCMALRREAFLRCVPFGRKWIHDEWLAFAVVAQGGLLVPITEALIDYRQHAIQQLGLREAWISTKIRRILDTEASGYASKADKVAEMSAFLRSRQARPEVVALLEERIFHARRRAAIGSADQPDRLRMVWEELRSGRYRGHSWSRAAFAKDLVRILVSCLRRGG
jgi:glycosyltransferase involved in cell wall biosynthesis